MHTSLWVRQPVQMNPSTPDDVLLGMIEDPRNRKKLSWFEALRGRPELEAAVSNCVDENVRADLAFTYGWAEGKLARATQQVLARDPSPKVRVNLARSTNYEDLFTALLDDADSDVRRHCAENPRASRDHIERLVTDRAWRVRQGAVAFGVRFPDEEQLIRLANDKSVEVRWAVVYNLRSPRAAIEIVALGDDEMNRHAALNWLRNGPPYAMRERASAAEFERSASATPGVFDFA